MINTIINFFGRSSINWSNGSLAIGKGTQSGAPSMRNAEGVQTTNIDGAMQISAVFRAVEILAKTISSMPIMVYEDQGNGQRDLARDTILWKLLHDMPNPRQTSVEFWEAMMLNLVFRGNAYARIERNTNGEAYALWIMPAEQIQYSVLDDGSDIYYYAIDGQVVPISPEFVLHIKEMGNGLIGIDRLGHMQMTLGESRNAQSAANKLFANAGKPAGLLMVDSVLNPEQKAAVKKNFSEIADGNNSRLHVLEANFKYQQVTLNPEDQQLLETRKFTIEEIGRWFGIPSVLLNHSEDGTALGSATYEVIATFYKMTIHPMVVRNEAALRKRLLTSRQRVKYTVEYNMDALLRASLKDRVEIYAKKVQNGLANRDECRQLENDPPIKDGSGKMFTAQSNLVPLNLLGKLKPSQTDATDTIKQ